MTADEPDEQLDPLSPADEARIRSLLADARDAGPVPAAVAARLDEVIVGLAAERSVGLESGYETNVRPLVRTRRHRVVAILGAAAAVAVVGLAIGTFHGPDDQALQDSSSADQGVDRGDDDADSEALAEGPARTESAEPEKTDPGAGLASTSEPYALRARHLGRDLARIRDDVLPDPAADLYSSGQLVVPEGFACDITPAPRAVLVAVRYDASPAYVSFQEPMGDSQVVEVLQCRTGDVLRSTTLPIAR